MDGPKRIDPEMAVQNRVGEKYEVWLIGLMVKERAVSPGVNESG
jgi:hypothetical protein